MTIDIIAWKPLSESVVFVTLPPFGETFDPTPLARTVQEFVLRRDNCRVLCRVYNYAIEFYVVREITVSCYEQAIEREEKRKRHELQNVR